MTEILTPLKAVRKHCLWCCNDSSNEVALCPAKACPLWLYRRGHRPIAEELAQVAEVPLMHPQENQFSGEDWCDRITPRKAIRARCLDCSGASYVEVTRCTFSSCSLHPHRFGKRPDVGVDTDDDVC